MKKLQTHLISAGMFFILLGSIIHPQDLTVKLCLEKKVYLKGEPIYAIAEITNNSSPIKIQPPQLCGCMMIRLMDSMKTTIREVNAWPPLYWTEGGIDLASGETVTAFCFVHQVATNSKEPGISITPGGTYTPGKYYLQFTYTYENPLKSGETKVFLSDMVEFRVEEPQSEADIKVYETLKKETANHIFERPAAEQEQYSYLLLDLAKSYPESRYFPSAYANFFYTLHTEDFGLIDSLIIESLHKHPDAFVNFFIADRYMNARYEVFSSIQFWGRLGDKTKKRLKGFGNYSKKLNDMEKKLK